MSFRRRKIAVTSDQPESRETAKRALPTGVRPSPLDGRLTTSTGTVSLDSFLAGHGGFVLGTSILIEESGNTDFGGILLRYYAAQGVIHGQQIHVLGLPENWGRELPGLSQRVSSREKPEKVPEERMKIAWRYERLPDFGGSRERSILPTTAFTPSDEPQFSHEFDLSKRLTLPSPSLMRFVSITTQYDLNPEGCDISVSPFDAFLNQLTTHIASSSPNSIHRIVIPGLLSPAYYPIAASKPEYVLQFLHALRALLRRHPTRLSAMISFPLTLYPRREGLTRWIELLSDGVIELAPFPSAANANKVVPALSTQEEPPQGMFKIHQLPVFHERGGGGGEASVFGNDLAFTLSRRKGLVIKPFSLPPVEGDLEAQKEGIEHDHGKAKKDDIEF